MRINKYVARATGMARRKVDSLVSGGQVLVNNEPAILGQQVEEGDIVTLAGKELHIPSYTYLLFNKPIGCVSSRHSQKGSKTVYDLLPSNYRHLKLVGRLDKESSGIMLLTDDGDFAHKMLHPSHRKSKIYQVVLDRDLAKSDADTIERGIPLEDGISKLKVLSHKGPKAELELAEGRNRQIRRTFSPLGYTVEKLHRTKFGNYELSDLEEGGFKEVKPL